MRKSIYYLIANAFSALGALIYICVLNSFGVERIYPYYSITGEVFSTATSFEPFKYILLVLAASIIFCAQDCVAASNSRDGKVAFQGLKDGIGGAVTIITVLYTWVSVYFILLNEYATGAYIQLPLWLIITYVVAIIILLCDGAISKVNDNIGAVAVLSSILLMIAGFITQIFVADYWWVALICYGSVLLIFLVLAVLVLTLGKKGKAVKAA